MKNKKKSMIILLIIIIGISATACSTPNTIIGEGKVIVYTSIYPIYDFTKRIAGDKVEVELLLPPGAEPHGWEPSAKTMAKIEQSQLFLYNGLEMDPWAKRIAQSLSKDNIQVLEVAEIDAIEPKIFMEEEHEDHEEEEEEEHGTYDPHVWLDPMIAEDMARAIKDQLIQVDEENRNYYEENFKAFQQELQVLDEEYTQILSQVEKREFIVAHAAFGYLASRYDLEQIAVSGLSPQSEPSPAKLVELTKIIKEKEIHTIFFENLSSPKVANVLAKETGAEVEVLNPIGGLTQEEMDKGEDYISIMRSNLEKLEKALQR